MSSDATAVVFFGFPLPLLRVDEGELNDEWLEEYRPKRPSDESNYKTPEWDEWRARLEAWKATPQFVEIDWCGSEDEKRYFIHCPCFETRIKWDLCELKTATDTSEAQKWLDEFCDRFNLPKKRAKWHLGARYF